MFAAIEDLPTVVRDPPWLRKRDRHRTPSLSLVPIPTPFAFSRALFGATASSAYCPPIDEVIRAVLHFVAVDAPFTPPPFEPGIEPRNVHKFYRILRESVLALKGNPKMFDSVFEGGPGREGALVFLLLNDCPGRLYSETIREKLYQQAMEHLGERAMPAVMKILKLPTWVKGDEFEELDDLDEFDLFERIDSSSLAPFAARELLNNRNLLKPSMAWLAKYRRTAILRLIPDAVGPEEQAREAAINALRWIATKTEGGRQEIKSLSQLYDRGEIRIDEALEYVLPPDPLEWYPQKIDSLPSWFDPSAMSRPELLSRASVSGGRLPDKAISNLAQMLSFCSQDEPYAGVEQVRQAVEPKSLAAFSWDLLSAWLAHKAPAHEMWALRALGWFADVGCALNLARLIFKWSRHKDQSRALAGLEVLSRMGSDAALMALTDLAEKVKIEDIEEKAQEMIAQIADKRGLTPEDLADSPVPELGLDESGEVELDFGARRFRAGFDERLQPWVMQSSAGPLKETSGKPHRNLPSVNMSDDAQLARQALERWEALKRDAKSIAGMLITRLENMLCTQRRMAPEVFWRLYASHRLVRNLTQRLVWGVYPDDAPGSPPTSTFRITDALTLTSQNDVPIEIDFGLGACGRIGLVHPMNPPDGGLNAWGVLFAEYEIAQPIVQLGRECFELTVEEKGSQVIRRFEGIEIAAPQMRGIVDYGWSIDPWVKKAVRVGGKRFCASLDIHDGDISINRWDNILTIGSLTLDPPDWTDILTYPTFEELDRVTASEILRPLTLIFMNASK